MVEIYDSFQHYITLCSSDIARREHVLFRGQADDWPLLPSIARKGGKYANIIERRMLYWLKQRSPVISLDLDEWNMLIYAQHHGLYTRLLDWTTNPLVALYFACREKDNGRDSIVWAQAMYGVNEITNNSDKKGPFDIDRTGYFLPDFSNRRLVAQGGAFTVHKPHNDERFIPLDQERDYPGLMMKIVIPNQYKSDILKQLNLMGVNEFVLYPDADGLCRHINWMIQDDMERYCDTDHTQILRS